MGGGGLARWLCGAQARRAKRGVFAVQCSTGADAARLGVRTEVFSRSYELRLPNTKFVQRTIKHVMVCATIRLRASYATPGTDLCQPQY